MSTKLDIPAPWLPVFAVTWIACAFSKQSTAIAVLRLERDGKLSLDDDIRQHFSNIPDYGLAITIRHLLNHTRGLRDYINLFVLAGVRP